MHKTFRHTQGLQRPRDIQITDTAEYYSAEKTQIQEDRQTVRQVEKQIYVVGTATVIMKVAEMINGGKNRK